MSNVGCYIDGQCRNHLMYADDICILAPTAIAMQQLLDIHVCNDYGVANDITFHPLKSVCLVFLGLQSISYSVPVGILAVLN